MHSIWGGSPWQRPPLDKDPPDRDPPGQRPPPPWAKWHRYKNITFPQLRWADKKCKVYGNGSGIKCMKNSQLMPCSIQICDRHDERFAIMDLWLEVIAAVYIQLICRWNILLCHVISRSHVSWIVVIDMFYLELKVCSHVTFLPPLKFNIVPMVTVWTRKHSSRMRTDCAVTRMSSDWVAMRPIVKKKTNACGR